MFGSATRNDLNDQSNIDLLVEFEDVESPGDEPGTTVTEGTRLGRYSIRRALVLPQISVRSRWTKPLVAISS